MNWQKYKIYINGSPLFITSPEGAESLGYKPGKNTFVAPFNGKKKMIWNYFDLLNKSKADAVVIHAPDVEGLWQEFQNCFKVLEAAGGFVTNDRNEMLVFYRRGFWDMPKGKIDPGETPEIAALREVEEETGVRELVLGQFICHSYHTYIQKDQDILKKTWWYHMRTSQTELIPQTEEDIEDIAWVSPQSWLDTQPKVYDNIRDLILEGLPLIQL